MTFKQATAMHLNNLRVYGWTVRDGLKIPHATAPDGSVRIWFKPQAVYASAGSDFGGARSLHADMRNVTTASLLADAALLVAQGIAR